MDRQAHPSGVSPRRWAVIATLACLLVSSLIFAVQRDAKPAEAHDTSSGGHLHCPDGTIITQGSSDCDSQPPQCAHGGDTLLGCHSASSPAHDCPGDQVIITVDPDGHVQNCSPPSCDDPVNDHQHGDETCHFAGAKDCSKQGGATSVDHHADCPTQETTDPLPEAVDCSTWTPVDHGGHTHSWQAHDSSRPPDGIADVCTYPHECGCTGVSCHIPPQDHSHTEGGLTYCHTGSHSCPAGETAATIDDDGHVEGCSSIPVCPEHTHNGLADHCETDDHTTAEPACTSSNGGQTFTWIDSHYDEQTKTCPVVCAEHTHNGLAGHCNTDDHTTSEPACTLSNPGQTVTWIASHYSEQSKTCPVPECPKHAHGTLADHCNTDDHTTPKPACTSSNAGQTVTWIDPHHVEQSQTCPVVCTEHTHNGLADHCNTDDHTTSEPACTSSNGGQEVTWIDSHYDEQTKTCPVVCAEHAHGTLSDHCNADDHTTPEPACTSSNSGQTVTWIASHYIPRVKTCPDVCTEHAHDTFALHCNTDGHTTPEPACTSSNEGQTFTWIDPHYDEQTKTCPIQTVQPPPQCASGQVWNPDLGRCEAIACRAGTLWDPLTQSCDVPNFVGRGPRPVVEYGDMSLRPAWGMGTWDYDLSFHYQAPTEWSLQWRLKDADTVTPGDQPGGWTQIDNIPATRLCVLNTCNSFQTRYIGSYTITGLVNDTIYEIRVQGHAGSLTGAWGPIAEGTPQGRPAKPTLTAAGGDQRIDMSWTYPPAGADVTGFDIRYRLKDTVVNYQFSYEPGPWVEFHQAGPGTTRTLTGLVNGEWYEMEVRGVNSLDDGDWSDIAEAQPSGVPSKMDAPGAAAGDSVVYLRWNPPLSDGGLLTSGYEIEHKEATAATWTTHTIPRRPPSMGGLPTNWNFGGVNGTTYMFRVRACNTNGCGEWSDITEATPMAATGRLSCVSALDAVIFVYTGGPWHSFNWTVGLFASDVSEADLQMWGTRRLFNVGNYSLEHGFTRIEDRSDANTVWGSLGRDAYVGVWPHGYFTVYAIDNVASCAALIRPGAPDAPTVVPGNRLLDLSWSAPTEMGSSPISDYDVRYRVKDTDALQPGEQPGWWWDLSHVGTATTATVGGLVNGTAYEVQVRAENAEGEGSWSPSGEGTPVGPPAVTVRCLSSTEAVEVDWSGDPSPGRMEIDADQALPWVFWPDGLGASASASLVWPPTGIKARRVHNGTPSLWTAEVDCEDFLAPVLTATGGVKQVSLSWTPPTKTGGLPITGWWVLYREQGVVPWTIHTPDPAASATADVITGLSDGTDYQVSVAAKNSVETGDWAFAAATTHDKPGRPGAPIVQSGNMQLDVSWVPPAANGSPITGYDIQYRYCTAADLSCNTNPAWSGWQPLHGVGNITSTTITGLTNDVRHQIQVRAVNAVGDGPWSPSRQGTPSAPPAGAPVVAGGDPAGGADPAGNGCYYGLIRAGWDGAGAGYINPPEHRGPRVMIAWTWDSDPDNDGVHDAITHFEVRGGNPDANGWQTTADLTAGTGTAWMWPANWSGPNGDHTDIQVRAANGSSGGPWSAQFQALCRLGVR